MDRAPTTVLIVATFYVIVQGKKFAAAIVLAIDQNTEAHRHQQKEMAELLRATRIHSHAVALLAKEIHLITQLLAAHHGLATGTNSSADVRDSERLQAVIATQGKIEADLVVYGRDHDQIVRDLELELTSTG